MASCIIADDSNVIRMLLSKVMNNFGYDVTEAENGEELLRLCTSNMPNLIICDWQLPLIDGIDVLLKIRSDKKLKQPAFIFCSYIKDVDVISYALKSGADDFIMRPFDEDIIASKLKIIKVLRGTKNA